MIALLSPQLWVGTQYCPHRWKQRWLILSCGGNIFQRSNSFFFTRCLIFLIWKEMPNFGLFEEGSMAELPQAAQRPLAQPHVYNAATMYNWTSLPRSAMQYTSIFCSVLCNRRVCNSVQRGLVLSAIGKCGEEKSGVKMRSGRLPASCVNKQTTVASTVTLNHYHHHEKP